LPSEPSSGEGFEIRFASLDLEDAVLRLHEVELPEDPGAGNPKLGQETILKLASIADGASAHDKALILRAGGSTGKKLLELHFSKAANAAAWARCLQDYRGDESKRAVHTLRQLIAQQEEQVRLLNTINARKGEQLQQLQEQLQRALEELTKFQATYSGQQKLVDEQAETIEELKKFAGGANNAAAACERNAAEAAAGAAAAAAKRAAAAKSTAAAAPSRQPQPQPQATRAAPEPEDDDDDDFDAEESPELKAMMEKLAALQAQKAMFEALLQKEQSGVSSEFEDVQRMLAALSKDG